MDNINQKNNEEVIFFLMWGKLLDHLELSFLFMAFWKINYALNFLTLMQNICNKQESQILVNRLSSLLDIRTAGKKIQQDNKISGIKRTN